MTVGKMIFDTPTTLYSTEQLPLTILPLTDWALVTLSGPDRQRYLQNQVTCDVTTLRDHNYLLGAHCDVRGKMWSCFQLFLLVEQLALLQRRSVCEAQLNALQQYALFSQVTIKQDESFSLLGIAGAGARQALQTIFFQLPTVEAPCLAIEDQRLLYFPDPAERYLLVTQQPADKITSILLRQGALLGSSEQWLALDIASGLPIIDAPNSGQLLPQAVQLDQLNGICFTKGCYMGQEGVARAQYRGTQKRACYWLTGHSPELPEVGDSLAVQSGEQWRTCGRVLARIRLADGTLWVQAVLPSPLDPTCCLRVRQQPESLLCSAGLTAQ
jgi:tRNA-modifying protein YgfZ